MTAAIFLSSIHFSRSLISNRISFPLILTYGINFLEVMCITLPLKFPDTRLPNLYLLVYVPLGSVWEVLFLLIKCKIVVLRPKKLIISFALLLVILLKSSRVFTSLNVKTLEDFNKITKSEAKEIINFLGIHP